jgi:hypothetical protein
VTRADVTGPDISGVWNFSTLTPLDRPPRFAGKQFLTAEEAADFESQLLKAGDQPLRKCGACDVTIIPGVATAGCMRAASAYLDSPSKTEISSRPANNSWHDAELLWRFMGSAPQALRCRLLRCRGAATTGVVWAGRR